jgi:hypothetical protein
VKVGDLVEHTVFKAQRFGIIIEMGPRRSGTVDVLWPDCDETVVESLFLLRLLSEGR